MAKKANDEARSAADKDRGDLLAVLYMRFQSLPEKIEERIEAIDDPSVLDRLILVAANARDLDVVIDELVAEGPSFRLVGDRFDPLKKDKA